MSADISTQAHRHDERSVTEQAADWVVELADGGPLERAAFLEWATESPRHVEEYLLAATLYKGLAGIDSGKQIDLNQLLADASLNVHPLKTSSPAPADVLQGSLPKRHSGWMASAAALGAVCILGVWWLVPGGPSTYSTGIGELRSVELPDGSVIDLNTQSQLEVSFSKSARTVRLIAGEALFKVERDRVRPFTVYADRTAIRVLGTRFNVYRRPQETAVTVIEGAVQVSSNRTVGTQAAAKEPLAVTSLSPVAAEPGSAELTAGKGATISSDGQIRRMTAVDPAKITAWRERRLVFMDDKLSDIVTGFNRYNAAPRLRVEGAYARDRQLTGVFDAGDPQSLVQFLENLGEFSVSTTADEIVIRQR